MTLLSWLVRQTLLEDDLRRRHWRVGRRLRGGDGMIRPGLLKASGSGGGRDWSWVTWSYGNPGPRSREGSGGRR